MELDSNGRESEIEDNSSDIGTQDDEPADCSFSLSLILD